MKWTIKRLWLIMSLVLAISTVFFLAGSVKAAPAIQGAGGLSADEITAMLNAHNDRRQKYNVSALVWDDTIAKGAQDWANHLAASGNLNYNLFSENLDWEKAGSSGPVDVVNKWGSAADKYDLTTNTCAERGACNEFKQLIWAGAKRVGCGKATGSDGYDYFVCDYARTANAQGTGGLSADEITALLNAQNDWRRKYNVPALVWDDTVAAFAQDWAYHLASIASMVHSHKRYGENIAMGPAGALSSLDVVNMWGNEVKDYDLTTNTCASQAVCGHFTQVVWSRSQKVGCGVATAANGYDFFVCNYDPSGNWEGESPFANVAGTSPADTTQPGTTQPGTFQPDPTQPDYSQPDYSQPGDTPTDTTQPDYSQPDYSQPGDNPTDTPQPDGPVDFVPE